MPKLRSFFIYWLPVCIWMVSIFGFSGDVASFKHTSRFLDPFFRWLIPGLSDDGVNVAVTLVRKCGHLTEFAMLAFLTWRACRKPQRGDTRPWLWSQAAEALWVAIFYASTDEFHQTFVPSREGCLRDVMIDTSGAILGLLALWAFGRWRKLW